MRQFEGIAVIVTDIAVVLLLLSPMVLSVVVEAMREGGVVVDVDVKILTCHWVTPNIDSDSDWNHLLSGLVLCKAWPEAVSQAKPSPNRPGQFDGFTAALAWLAFLESQSQAVRPRLFQWARISLIFYFSTKQWLVPSFFSYFFLPYYLFTTAHSTTIIAPTSTTTMMRDRTWDADASHCKPLPIVSFFIFIFLHFTNLYLQISRGVYIYIYIYITASSDRGSADVI